MTSQIASEPATGSVVMPEVAKKTTFNTLLPWLAGSGMAAGQAFLATGCSVPKVGKCVGCGSCIVAVVALSSWAWKERQRTRLLIKQGRQPFEI